MDAFGWSIGIGGRGADENQHIARGGGRDADRQTHHHYRRRQHRAGRVHSPPFAISHFPFSIGQCTTPPARAPATGIACKTSSSSTIPSCRPSSVSCATTPPII